MIIKRAKALGMCFGVRDALAQTEELVRKVPVSVLGSLVHNPKVEERLRNLGVEQLRPETEEALEKHRDYVITAHGVSDRQREEWKRQGLRLHDHSCPLVHRAHARLRELVKRGYYPVVIGQATHVEVLGLIGDYVAASVILTLEEVKALPIGVPLGVVAQTTQPIQFVRSLVEEIRKARPGQELCFVDTVCQPTKDRQSALHELCAEVQLVIVVGGRHSNNTRQLVQTSRGLGCQAVQVESEEDLQAEWFKGISRVGLTAGTSTLDETVDAVESQITAWFPHALAEAC